MVVSAFLQRRRNYAYLSICVDEVSHLGDVVGDVEQAVRRWAYGTCWPPSLHGPGVSSKGHKAGGPGRTGRSISPRCEIRLGDLSLLRLWRRGRDGLRCRFDLSELSSAASWSALMESSVLGVKETVQGVAAPS